MKRKRSVFSTLLLVLLLVLSGCSAARSGTAPASAPSVSNDMAAPPVAPAASPAPSTPATASSGVGERYYEVDGGYGYASDANLGSADYMDKAQYALRPEEGAEPPAADSGLPDNAKLIYRADLQLESTEFDEAAAGIAALVAELGGYFERNEVSNYSGAYRSAYYTVRVPADQFSAFCARAGELCSLRYFSSSAEDIGEQYYDTEVRLATQNTKYERLLDLLSKATTMEDIISLENAISATEYQIESLTGALRKYDSLVGFSTVSVSLHEVYRLTADETAPISFGNRLTRAFQTGLENTVDAMEGLVLFCARNLIGILIFLAVILAAGGLTRRYLRRRRAASPWPGSPGPTSPGPGSPEQ